MRKILSVILTVTACGSADDTGAYRPIATGTTPDTEPAGGANALDASVIESPTGGYRHSFGGAPYVAMGGANVAGGNSNTESSLTGGARAMGGAETGGLTTLPYHPGELGGDCINGSCSSGLGCNPITNRCDRIPECAGYQGFSCLYSPCNDSLVCLIGSDGYPSVCARVIEDAGAHEDPVKSGMVRDCRTHAAECTTRSGCD